MESETCDMCGKTITNNHPTPFCNTSCEEKYKHTKRHVPDWEFKTKYSPVHVVRVLRHLYAWRTAETWREYRLALDELIEGYPNRMRNLEAVVTNYEAVHLLRRKDD